MRKYASVLLLSLAACGGEVSNEREVKAVADAQGVGAETFNSVCATCHEVDGGGKQSVGAPALANLPAWYINRQLTYFRDGIRGAHPSDSEGAMMAVNAEPLDDVQIEAIATYIATLPSANPTPTIEGDTALGADHFSNVCSACHGSDGLGNEVLGSPPLVGQSDWYLIRQYQHFRQSVRGAHPDDQWGAQMVRIAPVLEDDVLNDVIAWVASQSPPN